MSNLFPIFQVNVWNVYLPSAAVSRCYSAWVPPSECLAKKAEQLAAISTTEG